MPNKRISREDWENAVAALTVQFVNKYFGKDASDFFWIFEHVGGVFCVNDYFFTLDRIIEAIKYNASCKKLFAYMDLELKLAMEDKKPKVNFRNYLKR